MIFGSLCILFSGVLFGVVPLVTMNLYASGFNTISVSFFRYLFAIPIALLLVVMQKKSLRINKMDIFKITTHLSLISVVTNLLLAGSYNFISTGTATTLHFLYPVVVILICGFYYREKISKQIMLSVMLVVFGILCFLDKIESSGLIGFVMAASSSVSYSIYILQLERTRLNRLEPAVLSFYISVTTVISLLVASFFIQPISFSLNYHQLTLFVALSVITLVALMLFQLGTRYLGAKLSALFSLSEPVTSMVVGVVFMGEPLIISKIIGCILILLAILIVTFRK